MRKDIRSSTSPIALAAPFPLPSLGDAMEEVSLSVDRFCLQGPCRPLLLDFSGKSGLTPFAPYRLVPGCHFGFVSKSVSSA